MNRRRLAGLIAVSACLGLVVWLAGACAQPQVAPAPTPTKTARPAATAAPNVPATAVVPAIPVSTHSPSPTPLPTATAGPRAAPTDEMLATAVTHTPTQAATSVPTSRPSATPRAVEEPTLQPPAATATPVPTQTPVPAPVATLPPLRGGSWDMEEGFYAWQSPFEGFTAQVANGWQPFGKLYDPQAPPRLNENKYRPNIHSGERSQEVSFDWRSGETGLYRTAPVVPGHRYTVEAWAKYMPSQSGLSLYLGIDLTGGGSFEAGTVSWYPWRDTTPDQWIATRETVRAQGDRLTIFLRSVHPLAADGGNKPGGNTMFDDVSLTDLGR
jgi:hypothetical protein